MQDMKMLENSYTSYLEKYILDQKNKEKILGGKLLVMIIFRIQMNLTYANVLKKWKSTADS